jgi:hypothetical protein
MSAKKYRNTSDKDLNVIGVGLVPAGEEISVISEYQPHVIMENYPGLEDVTDEQGPSNPPAPSTKDNSGVQSNG